MQRHRIVLLSVVSIAAAFPPTAYGQERGIDVRAHAGHAVGLDDSPPYAWVGGGTVTAAAGTHARLGLEFSYAHMFGPYSDYESRAQLFTGLWEYEFNRGGRVNPYAVAGVGMTLYQDLLPNVEHYFDFSAPELAWETRRSVHFHGGLWTYNGTIPGPTIRVKVGDRLIELELTLQEDPYDQTFAYGINHVPSWKAKPILASLGETQVSPRRP